MAEALAVVPVIIGLVSLADMVLARTSRYVKEVKQGHKERLDLNEEIGALSDILRELQGLWSVIQAKGDNEHRKPFLQSRQLHDCRNTLLTIKSKLDAYEGPSSAVTSASKPLRWPFTSSDVKNLLAKIERHKTNLSLALNADGISGHLQTLSIVHGIKSELDRIVLDEHRRKILDSFGSIDFRKNHEMSLKLWRPSTGLWLTEGAQFRGCLTGQTTRNMWCYGMPGSGKTVLASAVIEEVQKRCCHSVAAAYFYCDYKDVTTQDPINILGSLAKQLILRSERCFKESEKCYEAHHSAKQVSTSYRPKELCDLIRKMSSFFSQTMIIVDGLDECGKNTMIVVELLSSLSKREPSNIQTLFLSRDEIEIRESLTDYTLLSITADKADLQLYVAAELAIRTESKRIRINNPSIREHIMDRLVNGANGMFRWAACQIDYLCELPNDRERCDALETLPPDLKSTYERILERVDDMEASFRSIVQRTLRWLVVARRDLTIGALQEALSMKEGITSLDHANVTDPYDIQRACSSLVRKSASGQEFELAHFTVKEFLLDIDRNSRYSAYRVDVEDSEVELGKVCLTYLTLQDFNSKVSWSREAQLKRLGKYEFRHYAVKNWLSHADCRLEDPGLLTLIQKLLDPSKPGTFMTWTQDHQVIVGRTRSSGKKLYAAVATDTPLHYASAFALPEICKWLLDCGYKVDHRSRFGTPLNHALVGPSSLYTDVSGSSYGLWKERDNENILQVIDVLLEAGADARSKSWEGCPLIYYAFGDRDRILRLLRKGARYLDDDENGPRWERIFAKNIIYYVGRENFHEDDYAFLLERATQENAMIQSLDDWKRGKHVKATSAFIQATEDFR